MALLQKTVLVPASVETIVKSAVDLATVVKNGGPYGSLITDLVNDIQAVPTLAADFTANPFESVRSVLLGALDIAQAFIAPLPVKEELPKLEEPTGAAV